MVIVFMVFLGFFPTLLRLFLNPLYNLEVTASCFGVYYAAGWAGYLPKYFEDQFLLSANLASVLAGKAVQLSYRLCVGVAVKCRHSNFINSLFIH